MFTVSIVFLRKRWSATISSSVSLLSGTRLL
jgi:hypothetical protein